MEANYSVSYTHNCRNLTEMLYMFKYDDSVVLYNLQVRFCERNYIYTYCGMFWLLALCHGYHSESCNAAITNRAIYCQISICASPVEWFFHSFSGSNFIAIGSSRNVDVVIF